MIPTNIDNQLTRLRSRERLLRLIWGILLVAALCGGVLALACLTDWIIDRYRDTPHGLRRTLLFTQSAILVVSGYWFVVRPLTRKLTASTLAIWVEAEMPEFEHRLITAVELNRQGAKSDGMSPRLIESVTEEASQLAAQTDFTEAIDARRVRRCFGLAGILVALVLVPILWFPATLRALLARQLLSERPIPRSVSLESITPKVWPSGDPVDLLFEVSGDGWTHETVGHVTLQFQDGGEEEHPLRWKEDAPDGKAHFVAKIPSASVSFRFRAWLADGRTRNDGEVTFEPRPSLVRLRAWELLPEYCGLRPNGSRYEELQDKGDIIAFRESSARITIKANKRLAQATLQLMTSDASGVAEQVSREIPFESTSTVGGVVQFDLRSNEHAYRVVLEDTFGFRNKHLARRNISLRPDEPPQVMLLPERFPAEGGSSFLEDTEMAGIPAVPGRRIRIAYRTQTDKALDRAVLRYHVLTPEMEPTPDAPAWKEFPLREWKGQEEVGAFDLERGVFEQTGFFDEIEFHALPSPAPDVVRARLEGGGRFDFKTKSIPALQPESRIEYYVEVYDRKAGSVPGVSEVRVKRVVSPLQLANWLQQKRDETRRLSELHKGQHSLYDPTQAVVPE